MRLRSLACLAILLSCSGCALGAAGIAADVLAGVSVASMTVTGKGLGDQAISAAAGKDCRVFEGMVRRDRGICEAYKTAEARPPYLVEIPPPAMPEVLIGQPMQAQPAALTVALARPPTPPPVMPPSGMAQPILAAVHQEIAPTEDKASMSPAEKTATTDKPDAPAPASADEKSAAVPKPKPPEPPAIVMESEDSMKLGFGSGRSDKEVMAELHAAIAAWRETDKPAPPPPAQAAPAEPSQAAEPAKPAEAAKAGEATKTAEETKAVDPVKAAEPAEAALKPSVS